MNKGFSEQITREDFILQRIIALFKRQAGDTKNKKIFEKPENKAAMEDFFKAESLGYLFIHQPRQDDFEFTEKVPKPETIKKKSLLLVKHRKIAITPENIQTDVSFLEVIKNGLDNISIIGQEALIPVFTNPHNQTGWSDLVSKDLMEKFQTFLSNVYVTLGQMKGKTMLPLPSEALFSSENSTTKDKVHAMESAIIMWTKQIKNVLKQEPESAIKPKEYPGPVKEIEFWKLRAENLSFIHQQLMTDKIKRVLKFLDQNKSTYREPFSELQKEVGVKKIEAIENHNFLETLRGQFEELETIPFKEITELFSVIMDGIYLIYTHSKHYNKTTRLVVLIKEICNTIIKRATEHINGSTLKNSIKDSESSSACQEAYDNLYFTNDVCSRFKQVFHEYRAKANNEWKSTKNVVFNRLERFSERCQDIMHLVVTIMQFEKLEKIEIGGTKGEALSTSVKGIFNEFKELKEGFLNSQNDISDIEDKKFDNDFFVFKGKIKDLERRLAAIFTQAFDDLDTIISKFKLIESFEGLLNRPAIQDELERKYIVMIDLYKEDLKKVQHIFITTKDQFDNLIDVMPGSMLPNVSRALYWSRGLKERIEGPMTYFHGVAKIVQEREEYKDIDKLYNNLLKLLKEFEDKKVNDWSTEVEANSRSKLEQSLLKRTADNMTIRVNFDPYLTNLLKEIKHLKVIGIEIPKTADEIYTKSKKYRDQICTLSNIVAMYNRIETGLQEVERPLLEARILRMEKQISPGLEETKWTSSNVDSFATINLGIANENNNLASKMQSSIGDIKNIMDIWKKPMFEKKNKSMSLDDYMSTIHGVFMSERRDKMKESGKEIIKIIKEIGDSLKVEKANDKEGKERERTPWKAYEDYTSNIIIEGIVQSILSSLNELSRHITPSSSRSEMTPLFDVQIKLEKYGKTTVVEFSPPIGDYHNKNIGVRNSILRMMSDYISMAQHLSRVDSIKLGDYLSDLLDDYDIRESISLIYKQLNNIENETKMYLDQFSVFKFLWEEELESTFKKFIYPEEVKEEEDDSEIEKMKYMKRTVLKDVVIKLPPINQFEDWLTKLSNTLQKIKDMKTPVDKDWLRIDCKGFKDELEKICVEWIKKFAGFLLSQVKTKYNNLEKFNSEISEGIKDIPVSSNTPEEKQLLNKVMSHLRDMNYVKAGAIEMIGPMKEAIICIRKNITILQHNPMENDIIDKIEQMKTKIEETNEKAMAIKEKILPLQTIETKNIKEELDKFSAEVQGFRDRFLLDLPFHNEISNPEVVNQSYKLIQQYYGLLQETNKKALEYNNKETLFSLQKSEYKQLKDCKADLKNLKYMWDMIDLVDGQFNALRITTWDNVDADAISSQINVISTQVSITNPKNKEIKGFKAFTHLNKRVSNMKTLQPIITNLRDKCMEQRHWKQLEKKVGPINNENNPNFCLDDLLKIHIYDYGDLVSEIQDQAKKEASIQAKLIKIEKYWSAAQFDLNSYKETSLFNPLDEVLENLGNNSMELQSMLAQRHVEYFRERVLKWQKNLRTIDSVVELWIKVQKNWKRLESIFLSSDDIRAQLPDDTKKFVQLDEDFRNLMKTVAENSNIVESCTFEGREEHLRTLLETIESCEKSLKDYLEQKKKIFPRFYFVSDQALLDILSNANIPPKVAEYLRDMFDGMKSLHFTDKNGPAPAKLAIGMRSREDEEVKFNKEFVCEGNVENWLKQLEERMKVTLRAILDSAKTSADTWDNSDNPREAWLFQYPAQIVTTACSIIWTEEVGRAFEEIEAGSDTALRELFKIIVERINKLIEKVRGDLTPLDRIKIMTLITIDVHSRDIVDRFSAPATKVTEATSFAWLSQFKFYWEVDKEIKSDEKKCQIRITDWKTEYSYEFIGNCGRLVITPLTDRCYITLSQALNLTMGGAPAGPAGTGKTETVKDMGHAIGLPVIVYNCSEQMNNSSMAQIFMGLSQSGAWGCFDEFNRISLEVLSVVSTQVKTCLEALKKMKAIRPPPATYKFLFGNDDEINLIRSVGYFITMNPGYAGRTELPENLKALFRSCAMVVPDFVPICENMLMSEGFEEARDLSKKFITLYELSKELLSKQMHYDWGLRAIKSVLRMAGQLKRDSPKIKENPILMRALRDFNLPKIVTDDVLIFLRLIENLFPKVECDPELNVTLLNKAKEATKEAGFIDEKGFLSKVVQLAEILVVRHCCFIIGAAGSGKTTVWKILCSAYAKLKEKEDSIYEVISPKAVSTSELFGALSKTNEWKDGVLSVVMRDMSKEQGIYKPTQKYKIIILDGDVDTAWIETMNSVMDDNKVLTLVSNERIPLTPSMRLLFEITNLKYATPATVSRGGVLYINDNDIGWKPYLETWFCKFKDMRRSEDKFDLNELTQAAYSYFYLNFSNNLGENYLESLKSSSQASPVLPMVDISYIETTCVMIQSIWKQFLYTKRAADLCKAIKEKEAGKEEELKVICEGIFFFSFIWAVGGPMVERNGFHNYVKSQCKGVKLPEAGLCFDFFFNPETSTWCSWTDVMDPYVPQEDQLFNNIVVPTVDTTRLSKLISMNISADKPVILAGTGGTGKTTVIKDFFRTMSKSEYEQCSINFNNYTDSLSLQKVMEGKLEKRSSKILGPKLGVKMIYFMDDLNMPELDKVGSQPPIDLVRNIVDHKQWFDRDHLEDKKMVLDVLFLGCMNPKVGSFKVDIRLQRHFSVFSCITPDDVSLRSIYTSIMNDHWKDKGFDSQVIEVSKRCLNATISLFKNISSNPQFLPSSKKYHYIFSIRDVGKTIMNMMNIKPNLYRGYPSKYAKLWFHESMRVYYDRIVFPEDQEEFKKKLNEELPKLENGVNVDEVKKDPTIFTSFISESYLPIPDMATLKNALQVYLEKYNESKQNMNIVFFDQCMEHLTRVSRIIEAPAGNALLVGVGGTGKQSISRLASSIWEFNVMQITAASSFTINDLKERLQDLYRKAGDPSQKPIAFLMTDSQIQDEKFLVYINDILSSGYVPELFTKEELDPIYNKLRVELKSKGFSDEQMPEYFLNRSRKNIHIILAFSPVGEKFKSRCRKFPALISCTSIDWFYDWPSDALIDVARRFMEKEDLTPEQKEGISLNMAKVHTSINEANEKYLRQERRHNYTTPKSFLELIKFYKRLLTMKRDTLDSSIGRLEKGLEIIASTKKQVGELQNVIKVKLVEVEKATKETNENRDIVTKNTEAAQKEKDIANEEEKKADILASEAATLKNQCDKELESAKPALLRAEKAVEQLDKQKDKVNEYKDLKTPTVEVQEVAFAIMVLKKAPGKAEWGNAKKMMNPATKFLDELKKFDGQNIGDDIISKIKQYTEKPYFNYDLMLKKSVAAAYLCDWVNNILQYNEKYRIVKPLDDKAKEAQKISDEAKSKLDAARAKAKEATDKLEVMQKKLAEAEAQLKKIQDEFDSLQNQCNLANRLIGGLEGENKRWGENVMQLKTQKELLIGDSLLAAEFVSYIGAFSSNFRKGLWKDQWLVDIKEKKIPMTEDIDPLYVLCKESDIAGWKNDSLPSDRVSYENASVVISCTRWPLIIDPQLQGTKWIRGREKENLVAIQLNQKNWVSKVTDSVANGKKLVIENLGNEIDPTLDPLLSLGFMKRGNKMMIMIGNEEIEYNKDFKLYLITKLSNPHYQPEIAAQCTIINFIVTESGLEDQLLSHVINLEKPELESNKSELVRKQNDFQVKLAQLEDDLLNCLNEADQNTILKNEVLINSLETTKKTSIDIAIQSKEAQETETKINISREVYRRVAAEGAMLYFLLIQLYIVNHMYQYSLESFQFFFTKAINATDDFSNDEDRVLALREKIRIVIYEWVARGLYEKHKQIFYTQLTLRLMQKGILPSEPYKFDEVQFLMKCTPKLGGSNPISDWLPDTAWYSVQRMIDLEEFKAFGENLVSASTRFKEWYNDLEPEITQLPLDWKKLAGPGKYFLKLLVIRSMRPDRISPALNKFIRDALPNGPKFVDLDAGKGFSDILKDTFNNSSPSTPIFFVLSPGADPIQDVMRLGKYKDGPTYELNKNFWDMAMGQGMEKDAEKKLEQAHKEGHWVMLENIHLMPKWLKILEKKLDDFAFEASHANFRLFLSAEPSTDIPIGILERCIKLTNEPPQGMRMNMLRAFTFFNKDEIEEKDAKIKTVLFALCFFHAVVIERKRFGPIGWNNVYPFNMGDLRDSSIVLNNYMERDQGSANKLPWDDLRYIFGEIMYGGHITDDWDRRLCKNYLEYMMKQELLEESDLVPYADPKSNIQFKCPLNLTHDLYVKYIEENIKTESPMLYGLHPNAEIGYRTQYCKDLFTTLQDLQPRDSSSGVEDINLLKADRFKELKMKIETDVGDTKLSVEDIKSGLSDEDRGPYQNVFLLECEYMNILTAEITKSITELELAFNGQLSMTDRLEQLVDYIYLDKVPEPWAKVAYPSERGLISWIDNLKLRLLQLNEWKDSPTTIPKIVYLNRLFNPQSFLTAIKQVYSINKNEELNKLYIQTEITKKTYDQISTEIVQKNTEAAYCYGMHLEGARWEVNTNCMEESAPKKLFHALPITLCKAEKIPERAEGKEDKSLYMCPVYKTSRRGPTYVFTAQIKIKAPAQKWVLAGVAIILDVEGVGDALLSKDTAPAKK